MKKYKNINELEEVIEKHKRLASNACSVEVAEKFTKELVGLEDQLYKMNGEQSEFQLKARQPDCYGGECESCS